MKKIIIAAFLFFFLVPNINAASASISVRNSRTTMVIGQTFTTTVTVSSASPLGAWNFDLKYDSSKVKLTSSSFGGTYIADVFKTQNQKSATYTFNFVAIAKGTPKVYVANSRVLGYDEVEMSVSNGSTTLKIMTQAELEATYSKNNYLKSLSVDGGTLSPVFNKETLEYYVELVPDTKTATISGAKDDADASVTGLGAVNLVDGDNPFNIVVTAENGSNRTYKLNIHVKELDPIEATVDSKKYTVVRKKELVVCPTFFVDKVIKYAENDVPGCYNEASKINLLMLKNEAGTPSFFTLNTTVLAQYKEIVFNRFVFQPLDFEKDFEANKYFEAKALKIGDYTVNVYQYKANSDFNLLYGVNVEDGTKGFYLYDSKELTIQRYSFDNLFDIIDKEEGKLFAVAIPLAVVSTILLATTILLLINNNKMKKKNNLVDKIVSGKKEDRNGKNNIKNSNIDDDKTKEFEA